MATGQFAAVYRQIERLFTSGSVAGLNEGQLLDRFVAHRDDAADDHLRRLMVEDYQPDAKPDQVPAAPPAPGVKGKP